MTGQPAPHSRSIDVFDGSGRRRNSQRTLGSFLPTAPPHPAGRASQSYTLPCNGIPSGSVVQIPQHAFCDGQDFLQRLAHKQVRREHLLDLHDEGFRDPAAIGSMAVPAVSHLFDLPAELFDVTQLGFDLRL